MATANFGTLVDPQEEGIKRQRALAQALQEQSMSPMQAPMGMGGMVGRISPIEGIAKLAQALAGKSLNDQTDASQKAYNDQKRAAGAADVQGVIDALRGTPAQTIQPLTPNDDEGNPMPVAQKDAVAPDMTKALALALKSENPMVQGIGGSLITALMPKAPKMERVEIPDGKGGKQVGFVDMNSPDPMKTFQAGGVDPAKGIAVNGQVVSPYAMGTTVPKQPDAPNPGTNLVLPDPNNPGKMILNQPLIAARKDIAKAGSSNTQVSVNTAMKPLLGEIGKGAGEQINADFAGARSALQTLQNVEQIQNGLGKAILGPGANVRVTLGQLGQVLGVNGKDATEQLQNTRNVVQGLARQELAAAGTMKGQGQITDSEREILRKAESGKINEMTTPEVQTLLGALTKTANYRIGVHQQNLERLSRDPAAAEVIKYMQLPTGGAQQRGSVTDQADAILGGKK